MAVHQLAHASLHVQGLPSVSSSLATDISDVGCYPALSRRWIRKSCKSRRAFNSSLPRGQLLSGDYPVQLLSRHSASLQSRALAVAAADVQTWVSGSRKARLAFLEEEALSTLRKAISDFKNPAFPCALIAGDVVILHLLDKLGALRSGEVKVIFIDTFHLFKETHEFLRQCEEKYGFKAHVFHADGVANREEYVKKFGSDLFIVDIDEYDKICKVEPFGRALKTLEVDVMINGRRRDHGADRAHLELFEDGDMVKAQPLAYWEFRDCWDYIKEQNIAAHPLHEDGYPSIGDIFSTLPVPRNLWFEYGGERSGRFQGLRNKDGSEKTECGIHVGDAREVTSSSLSSSLTPPSSSLTSSELPAPPASSLLSRPT